MRFKQYSIPLNTGVYGKIIRVDPREQLSESVPMPSMILRPTYRSAWDQKAEGAIPFWATRYSLKRLALYYSKEHPHCLAELRNVNLEVRCTA